MRKGSQKGREKEDKALHRTKMHFGERNPGISPDFLQNKNAKRADLGRISSENGVVFIP
jgi:hypothetical protein